MNLCWLTRRYSKISATYGFTNSGTGSGVSSSIFNIGLEQMNYDVDRVGSRCMFVISLPNYRLRVVTKLLYDTRT